MKKIKSLVFTGLICVGVFSALYFTYIDKGVKKDFKEASGIKTDTFVKQEDSIEMGGVLVLPEVKPDSTMVLEELQPVSEMEKRQEEITPKLEEKKKQKQEEKKEDKKIEKKQKEKQKKEDEKDSKKESRIGVDRKLISGVPGTLNYKGKFPANNVKEKGSITVSYTVDENGKVISVYRTAGLRDRNTINNAVTIIRKHVRAEKKAKTTSKGTYTLTFE